MSTPAKSKHLPDPGSPDKFDRHAGQSGQKAEKIRIPSFLEGFSSLTEDDLDIIADFEEEQSRIGHFELLFPTKETIDVLGAHFDSQRHANSVLWQYIRQKQPIDQVKKYFRTHP